MEDSKTIVLRNPISVGTGDKALVISQIDLREPTAGELNRASTSPTNIGVGISLIAIIAKIPPSAVEQIPQTEFQEAVDFLEGFTRHGQTDGSTS